MHIFPAKRNPLSIPTMSRSIRSTPGSLGALLMAFALSASDCGPLPAQASLAGVAQPPADSAVPRAAAPGPPAAPEAQPVWEEARRASGRRILVSLAERRLWLMDGDSVRFSAPVAVGKSVVLEFEDQAWNFATPRGRRRVIGKQKHPVWVPPDWHYVELALAQGWKLEAVHRGHPLPLSDGSEVTVRGNRLGRLLPDGSFVAVPPGEEAVFEGTLFMPPTDTENRRIPGELGRFKLDLGDAYYFHGTPYPESVGTATTHGCIRMLDDDLEYLFRTVEVGTPVFLY